MLIISPYKDYYDYVAHIYGGGDPKIVYNRGTIAGDGIVPRNFARDLPIGNHEGATIGGVVWSRMFRTLVICGKPILLEKTEVASIHSRNYYSAGKHNPIIPVETDWHVAPMQHVSGSYFWRKNSQNLLIEQAEYLRKYALMIKHPVFVLSAGPSGWKNDNCYIEEFVPKLSQISGVAALYPAEQIYQNIAYWLGNEIKENPDGSPEPIVTDIIKIESHGFDKKRSFRPNMK